MKTLSTLQAYRGLAAVMVVLSHACNLSTDFFATRAFDFLFRLGNAGVAFFFVLSGFVMVWAHEHDFGRPERIVPYLRKRAVRIYPLYIFVTLLLLPVWLAVPGFGAPYHHQWLPLVKSLLLFPQWHGTHLTVGWTLTHEILFYLLFATLLFSRTGGLLVIAAWVLAIIPAELSGFNADFPASFLLNEFNLLFPLGMLAAWAVRRIPALRGTPGTLVFVAGNVLFLLALMLEKGLLKGAPIILIHGAFSCLIVAGAASASLEDFFRKRTSLLFWGTASYSLYLIHYPAMSFAVKVFLATGTWARTCPAAGFAGLIATGLIAGAVLYRGVETPLIARLKGNSPRS